MASNQRQNDFTWGHETLRARFAVAADGTLSLVELAGPDGEGPAAPDSALPLVELTALGHGSGWSGPRFTGTAFGARLAYRAHRTGSRDGWDWLTVELHDPATGLTAFAELTSPTGLPVLRSRVRLRNEGGEPLVVQSVSSLLLGGLPSPDALDVHRARNDWLAECRWYAEPLRAAVADINMDVHEHDSRAALALTGRGSWPTDGHLAMGALTERDGGRAWVWQVESPAGWRWDVGQRAHGTYLALNGPTDAEHQWRLRLAPAEEFTTVPGALALGSGLDTAMGALTSYRRAIRRPHPDHTALPVVFNDYMNTLMGDPTTAKLLPLIDAAADAGAEYFCIDSGWYDDDTRGWWDSVGAWQPSPRRFPDGGIQAVLDRIRERGMVPGLWLEPEVVGVRSPVASELPPEAFFQRDGVRLTEQGRHQLDLRHPAARAHLDKTVDRIVGDWGVGYLKLDYNILVDPGTQAPGDLAPGAGLLGHAHAYLDWLSAVLDRHPGLVVENCASGGMRMDGATLAVAQLQSTSDQQDPLRYAPIAAAAPSAVPPEQGAVWAYPQPGFDDDLITWTLGGALLGRIHLSGHLNRMSEHQLALVRDAVTVYKSIRGDLARALPFWPLGLPGWTDEWLALGLRGPGDRTAYLSVWRRGGPAELRVPLRHLAGRAVRAEVLHPTMAGAGRAVWQGDVLSVTVPRTPGALLIRLTQDD
ncbi:MULTISPECIES: alpha-galactosidase [Streptomyces]|uniref:Alpha-galactosidase n=1 Tax=Streptomyces koelreuteriae TaxID=2838015 RepID=A0ABX8G5J7_9ACTN|nr:MULTISPECIES: alpha-galactosidase [Streptomyces]QWB28548.1 alpha-galactosidase [Streptomyces koelreuteriae]UUA11540.1 alpha-galactosidase [Streptomyces koelreuteriae]UUA19136.1 alpha-galactosidase [Streptomyces sp. CRCS-T-1]